MSFSIEPPSASVVDFADPDKDGTPQVLQSFFVQKLRLLKSRHCDLRTQAISFG